MMLKMKIVVKAVQRVNIHTSNLRNLFEQREKAPKENICQMKNSKNFLDDDEREERKGYREEDLANEKFEEFFR